jgi:hypothetical protein
VQYSIFLYSWHWHVTQQHTQNPLLCFHCKMVTRTPHNVTLHEHCRTCLSLCLQCSVQHSEVYGLLQSPWRDGNTASRRKSQNKSTLPVPKCKHWSSLEQSNAQTNGRPGALFWRHKGMTPLIEKEEGNAQFRYMERQLVVNALWWWERAKVYRGTLISFCVPLH